MKIYGEENQKVFDYIKVKIVQQKSENFGVIYWRECEAQILKRKKYAKKTN